MSATTTPVNASLAAEMEHALELHVGAAPWPPLDDVQYIACGIYADDLRLAAFIVVHPEGGHLVPDSVLVDITEIEAFAVARRYGVDPNGRHYDIEHLADAPSSLVGLPLSQAMWLATRVSERPPPSLPLQYRSWRHALVFERIVKVIDVHRKKWRACLDEDGEQVRDMPYNDRRVDWLISKAKERQWEDDLDAADRYCERAEAEMVSGCEDVARATQGAST